MVLVIGEILVDLIGKRNNDSISLTSKLGGAPFNVASNLSNLGIDTTFIGTIGDDSFGRFITEEVNKNKKINKKIDVSKNYETTLALFIKDKNNNGSFEFIRKHGADFHLNYNEIKKELRKQYNFIHFGSLFLSSLEARSEMNNIIDSIKENTIKTFDVNIRDDIFSKDEDYKEYYLEFIKKMDVVKFANEEILFLSKKNTIEEALEYFSFLKLIVVTFGKDGSLAYYKHKIYKKKSKEVNVFDPIGAGDSFFSGIIYMLHSLDLDNLNELDINKMLNFANLCGAKTCMQEGAINAYSSYKDIIKEETL